MLGVVAMLETNVTWNTEVKVLTSRASNKAILWELCLELVKYR